MASSHSTELVEVTGSKSLGYFKLKEFLSVEEIHHHLQRKSINKAGANMRSNIEQTRCDIFLHLPVEFSIAGLQHCTTLDSTKKILESQSFKGTTQGLRLRFTSLSFWAVEVSSSDIEKAGKEAYTHVQKKVRKCEAEEYQEELTKQFANSPAFNKLASRYGNFRFSLPFSDLLSLYRSQFCGGEEPQLSILGTDIYKQEIAHYVVVHSPDSSKFKDLPRVPNLQTRCEPLPCVFSLGDTLYWRPESTSDSLEVLSKNGEITGCPLQPTCDWYEDSRHCIHKINCVWNQLVIAFHIPYKDPFKIPVEKLINNLSACEGLKPFMKDSKMEKTEAEKRVKELKQKYARRSHELQPKADFSDGGPFRRRADRTPISETNIIVKGEEGRTEAEPNVKLQFCRASTRENEEVMHAGVKQEGNGGSVTGEHAAERKCKRRDPNETGKNVEQFSPPLKKK